jgi:cell division protein FtsQ|nr:FtsQ-type POTRA domain-containing protein [Acidimicrobiia bacterium]
MGIEMDRRLAERRRRVAEERARSNLGRLLRLLIALGVAGAVVWFMHSPFMSVGRIVVDGARQVDVEAVLAQHGIYEGRPLLFLDVASAEAALLEDPWVAEATVARDWPTTVLVEVVEREPAVAVRLADGWWSAAADGVLLERAEQRPDGLPAADFADVPSEEVAEDLDVAGAIEYLAALPPEYRADALVVSGDEGLEGTVAGFRVRIGRPFDTAEKARVTAAILEQGVEEGSVITVMAPANPAVLPPGAGEETTDGDDAGEGEPETEP